MTCYRPNRAVQGYHLCDHNADGVVETWAQPKLINPSGYTKDGARTWRDDYRFSEKCYIKKFAFTRELNLPCGWCLGCRLDNSRMWALRMMHEARYSTDNYFITLTYSDKNMPFGGDLRYSDLRDFFKRARHLFQGVPSPTTRRPKRRVVTEDDPAFRYFACGEYGDKTLRPHYHFCAYNFKIDDLRPFKQTKTGMYFTSQSLTETWRHGHVIVVKLDWACAKYVSGYVTKKMNTHEGVRLLSPETEDEEAQYYTIQRAFQSKGLGLEWYNANKKEVWDLDGCLFGGKYMVRVPRFYFKQLQRDDPDKAEDVLMRRLEKYAVRPIIDTTLDRELIYAQEAKRLQMQTLVRSL